VTTNPIVVTAARTHTGTYPAAIHAAGLLGLTFAVAGDDAWRDLAWRPLLDPRAPHPPHAGCAPRDIGAR
jgi:hypothetical protein